MTAPWYRWDGPDLLLSIHAQPGAKTDRLDGMHGDRLKVRIGSPAVDGRANDRLLRYLADVFDVPPRQVELQSGQTCRSKRVRIRQPRRLPPGILPSPD